LEDFLGWLEEQRQQPVLHLGEAAGSRCAGSQ
jgi:hypothetical protein